MTTLQDTVTTLSDAPSAARRRIWPRVLVAFLAGVVLSLAVAAGALVAWDASYEGRILPGVSVGTVDLSGMDRDQAVAALGDAYASYGVGRVVVHTAAGDATVRYDEFGRRADIDAMVDAAMQVGRSGTILERAIGQVRLARSGALVAPLLVFDRDALEMRVVAAVKRFQWTPRDSRLVMDAEGIHIIHAQLGRAFDARIATAAAVAVVGRTDAPAEIVVDAPMSVIAPAHDDADAVAAKLAAERMITDVVVSHGDKSWTIKAKTVRTWVSLEPMPDGTVWPVVDEAAIPAALKKVAKGVLREPVSATYLKSRAGKIVGVVASKDGRKLDADATAAAIAAALAERAGGAAAEPVKAKVTKVEPKLTTAEATTKGPLMARLGSWKTWFPVSERNYFGANIWLPAKKVDGTVLRPGQRFEWWSALGPVTPAQGYGPGGFIAGNHTEPTGALGGGMCSSSTTLFNAALRAGLQMGARANHRYYIDRYPLGLDATVSKTRNGTQTVSFTNDMAHPIVIRTFRYRAGGRGWVRYEIWGIPDGRTVSIGKPVVSNVRKATTKTVVVDTLRPGQREQVEYPANGMDVAVSRTVRAASGRVLHRETYRTRYALWNGRIEIGR